MLGVALLYERRRWLLPLQLAIGVGGQQVRVWAMRPSNDIVFSTPRYIYIYIETWKFSTLFFMVFRLQSWKWMLFSAPFPLTAGCELLIAWNSDLIELARPLR